MGNHFYTVLNKASDLCSLGRYRYANTLDSPSSTFQLACIVNPLSSYGHVRVQACLVYEVLNKSSKSIIASRKYVFHTYLYCFKKKKGSNG